MHRQVAVLAVLGSLGSSMMVIVKNHEGNMRKVRDAVETLGAAGGLVRALLQNKIDTQARCACAHIQKVLTSSQFFD